MLPDQNILVTVDAVLFGYNKQSGLSILLIKRKIEPYKHQWALPGGFVSNAESLEEAVYRELKEETGVSCNFLEQLYTFGTPDRDPRKRILSVAYFGLVSPDNFIPVAATDAEDAKWFGVRNLPTLAFDHFNIIGKALDRLRGKMSYEPIGFELLGEKFPFSDLEQLYKTVLGRNIDRRNFRKKILRLGFVEELEELSPGDKAGRPGHLYIFNKKKFAELKEQGFTFDIVV